MREIIRTNDAVVLSFARSLLDDAGVPALVADEHMSIMEGSLGIFPRRLLVSDDDWSEAQRILGEGGLGEWLITP